MTQPKARSWREPRTIKCPCCPRWIPCPRGRLALDKHLRDEHPEAYARQQAVRADLLGIDEGLS